MTLRGSAAPDAGRSSPRRTSGSRSTSPGHVTVPNSRSTVTDSKTSRSSRIGANTPPACSTAARSTSCTAPSAKVSRSQRSASGSTSVTAVRDAFMAAVRLELAARGNLGAFPIGDQFVAMDRRPLSHHPQRSIRQRPAQDLARRDHHDRLVPRIDGVKMGRGVIREVHPNHDAVEATDRRHTERIPPAADAPLVSKAAALGWTPEARGYSSSSRRAGPAPGSPCATRPVRQNRRRRPDGPTARGRWSRPRSHARPGSSTRRAARSHTAARAGWAGRSPSTPTMWAGGSRRTTCGAPEVERGALAAAALHRTDDVGDRAPVAAARRVVLDGVGLADVEAVFSRARDQAT
jgi:hypothetical protein